MKLNFESGPRTGESVTVDPGRSVVIGRDPSADVFVDDARVSRPHARIWVDANGGARIEDLKSTNGTFVNGQKVEASTPLRSGDSVAVGSTRITIVGDAPSGAATVVGTVVGQSTSAASPPPSRTSTTVIRQSVASANRTAKVAIGAVGVLLVAIVAVGVWYVSVGRQPTVTELSERLTPSTVFVGVQNPYVSGNGTGWVYDAERGLIITNNHVIDGIHSVSITGNGLTPRTANIVAASPCDDVAMVHVDDKAGLIAVKLGSQGALRAGDKVLVMGYPISASPDENLQVTDGIVSVVKTRVEGSEEIANLPNVIQHTAKVNPGNSGGPLINQSGEVVGMNTLSSAGLDQNYAVGIDRIKELVDGLAQGRGIGWTGMGLAVPTADDLFSLGLTGYEGLLVVSAVPGTEADKAGFGQIPVLVTAIDGQPISDMPSYCGVAASMQSGDKSTFSIVIPDPSGLGLPTEAELEMHYR